MSQMGHLRPSHLAPKFSDALLSEIDRNLRRSELTLSAKKPTFQQ